MHWQLKVKRQKQQDKKRGKTHETSPNRTSSKHGQHNTKNINMLLSPKNKTKVQKNTSHKQNTKASFSFIHENPKKRKRSPRGVIFKNKKSTNETAVLKRFQISVSNRLNMIGQKNDGTCRHAGLAWWHTWYMLVGVYKLVRNRWCHSHDWSEI